MKLRLSIRHGPVLCTAGVGIIVGPVVGGLLDQWGGFYLPFLVRLRFA